MSDWKSILEDDNPVSNPANWIDGHYVGPVVALVMRALARHETQKEARKALKDRPESTDASAIEDSLGKK